VDCDAHELAGTLVSGKVSVAVVGGGWAGLAAAVEASAQGHTVTLYEMAPHLGGRSREVELNGTTLDNGQHILIGAYTETLRLMRFVGVDTAGAFLRMPLCLVDANGVGLRLNRGAPVPAFTAAVLNHRGWGLRDKAALLRATLTWALRRFQCDAGLTVSALTRRLPRALRDDLIEPLCIAALNTSASEASATVFLRVLRDALFSGPGSSDLLVPRISLSACFPTPARLWLTRRGSAIRLGERVEQLQPKGSTWRLNESSFDRVVLATSATEAARLARPFAPQWAQLVDGMYYEPIVTVYVQGDSTRLPDPMLALHGDAASPAQFVFDRGQLGGPAGLLAFVVSGARQWLELGIRETEQAVLRQATRELPGFQRQSLQWVRTITEKRATFSCTPAVVRAEMHIAEGLNAAGDHVRGPYPATLEGAVRSGIAAARIAGEGPN
jgi:squalene-associated FAD-dependent desaturase